MAEQERIEQLDRLIEARLAPPRETPAAEDPELAALAGLAADLRELPRAGFKSRLESDLQRRTEMSDRTGAEPVREGFGTVTPYLVVERLPEFLDFVTQAFGAEETLRAPGSAGGTHLELRIDDAMIMAGGPGPAAPVALHLYVPDADTVYGRALAAGAASIYEPMDMPYGDREGGVKDGFGNNWYIATNQATGHRREGLATLTPTLHPRGADSLMDFLKEGLGAEEQSCTRSPEGTVIHAEMRIGASVVEIGEARDPIDPTAAMLLVDVEDVDAHYECAIGAGAVGIEPPADQPYGARRAGVKDPHGNTWYFSAPIAQ